MDDNVSNTLGVAGRYANALFGLAKDGGAIEAVEADLQGLQASLDASADLRRLIASPMISRDDQWRGLEAVLKAMQVTDLTRNFVGVVTQNRRLFALPDIIDAFVQILAAHRGAASAEVVSARPLGPDQVRALEGALKSAMGRTVALTQKVEEDILGGLIVRVGSVMIDSSLRSRLNRLEIAMREVS